MPCGVNGASVFTVASAATAPETQPTKPTDKPTEKPTTKPTSTGTNGGTTGTTGGSSRCSIYTQESREKLISARLNKKM